MSLALTNTRLITPSRMARITVILNNALVKKTNPEGKFITVVLRGYNEGKYLDEIISVRPRIRKPPRSKRIEHIPERIRKSGTEINTYATHLDLKNPWYVSYAVLAPPQANSREETNAYYILIGDGPRAAGAFIMTDDPEFATFVHEGVLDEYDKFDTPQEIIDWLVDESRLPVQVFNQYPSYNVI